MFMKMSILIRNACFSIVISPQIDSIHFIIHYLLFEAHDKCTCVSVWICRRPSIHLTLKFEWTKRAIADAKCVFYCLFAILIYQVTPLFYFSPLPFSSSTVCDNWMAHETKPATYALRRSSRTYHALYNCFFFVVALAGFAKSSGSAVGTNDGWVFACFGAGLVATTAWPHKGHCQAIPICVRLGTYTTSISGW